MFIYVVFCYDPVRVIKICDCECDAMILVEYLDEHYPDIVWDWRALNVALALANLTGIC